MALKKSVSDELENVVDQIEQEEMRHLDLDTPPLDEEGVVRNVPLLAGYIDKEGVLHDTFSYREMTGRDEEAISKADIKSNGAKLINTLIERCVVEIGTLTKKSEGANWGKIIRDMLGGDLDYMAFKIRELSKGKDIEFSHKCPSCGQKLITIVGTDEFEMKPFQGQREIEFDLIRGYKDRFNNIHKHGVIKLPTGLDREIITPSLKKNVSTATTLLLTRCMRFEEVAVSQNQVNEMSIRDRDMLEKLLRDNAFGLDTSLDNIMCDNCGAEITLDLGQSNFL